MKKQFAELFVLSTFFAAVMVLPVYLGGCDSVMFPTLADVKTLAESENEHRTGLQAATVETMTEQHTAMTPELEEVLAVILEQNREMSNLLKTAAAEKVSSVEGPSIGGVGDALGGGLIPSLLSMFGLGSLIPIYNMFFGRSRGESAVAAVKEKSENDLSDLKEEIAELKLNLATKAGANETIPG